MKDINIEDFGKKNNHDQLMPTGFLLILIGIAILLFNHAICSFDDAIKFWSLICGAVYIIAFMFYLTEYYEQLWLPFYLLPSDKMFFRIYGIGIGIVIISLLPSFPEYWYLYNLVLFIWLYGKKRQTFHLFKKAFNTEYGNYKDCKNKIDKSKLILAEHYTKRFFWKGIIVNIAYSIILFILYESKSMYVLHYKNKDYIIYFYILISGLITVLTVIYWYRKITKDLSYYKHKINEGEYEFFEYL
jgi:membrane-associated HD superfamily phosphohydrolase